ncbi:hypothetical protein [Scytonema sp. HK-05]|uniref:hypothetical protein n=1 Tax=Scytonema sp. HK-05 TaxID=1137095 RepID=UPI001161008A|nr:hypothetical protein [Scytonema sp. HK-05]
MKLFLPEEDGHTSYNLLYSNPPQICVGAACAWRINRLAEIPDFCEKSGILLFKNDLRLLQISQSVHHFVGERFSVIL